MRNYTYIHLLSFSLLKNFIAIAWILSLFPFASVHILALHMHPHGLKIYRLLFCIALSLYVP
jgi:hypothetical protein